MDQFDKKINQLARVIKNSQEARLWFATLSEDQKVAVLRKIYYFLMNAGARLEDIDQAIELTSLKPTSTAAVLLKSGNLKVQGAKVINLPANEQEKSFLLLLGMFSVADDRRRQIECANGCSHWWHME